MNRWATRSLVFAATLFFATSAHAFALRSPQVVFNSGPLQGFLNIADVGINVNTDQLDAQAWSTSFTGNTDFTLVLKGGAGGGNAVGVYNAAAAIPALFQVFPPAAIPGWFAALHFSGGNLTVNLFDQFSNFMGSTSYPGVSATNFGFYTQGSCGLWFSQDFRNPMPQMLAYASNATPGDYWLCWSACPSNPLSTFNDVVLNIQSVRPTPANSKSWGKLKIQYR